MRFLLFCLGLSFILISIDIEKLLNDAMIIWKLEKIEVGIGFNDPDTIK